jgi:hypothetical protein
MISHYQVTNGFSEILGLPISNFSGFKAYIQFQKEGGEFSKRNRALGLVALSTSTKPKRNLTALSGACVEALDYILKQNEKTNEFNTLVELLAQGDTDPDWFLKNFEKIEKKYEI